MKVLLMFYKNIQQLLHLIFTNLSRNFAKYHIFGTFSKIYILTVTYYFFRVIYFANKIKKNIYY